jgi:hypothetical protein
VPVGFSANADDDLRRLLYSKRQKPVSTEKSAIGGRRYVNGIKLLFDRAKRRAQSLNCSAT